MADARAPLFTAADIASVAGAHSGAGSGILVGDPSALVASVVVDSRKVEPLSLFVALPGERSDGHDFIGAALDAGASCVIARSDRRASVEAAFGERAAARGAALVFVPDALSALQDLARSYRRRFPRLLRIGITG